MSDDVMMDTRVHNDEVKKDEERKAQRRAKIATGGATDAIAIASVLNNVCNVRYS